VHCRADSGPLDGGSLRVFADASLASHTQEEAAAAAEEAEPEELSVEAQLQAKLDELQGSHEEMENRHTSPR